MPRHIEKALEKIKDDDEQVKAFGVQEAVRVCQQLIARGHKFMHYYTMNLEQAVTAVVEGLGLLPQPNLRELSWQRHKATGSRTRAAGGPTEEVRPIFWANRQTSYVSRTNAWDEFPNGRWGDSRSPAYGELSHYYLEFKRPKVDRQKLWGLPTKHEDVYDVFVRFLDGGKVNTLPWCEQSPAPETSAIASNLKLLNGNGYLTINSQPAVDGRPSTDPEVGWGGPGGFVYQKAYVEFFCSPAKLKVLLEELDRHPNLSYHAVNVKGQEYTNARGGVNAVTWGVFPGREIVQPTVVDAVSFGIWKDEAFELWLTQWASAYEEGSQSRAVIQDIHDTFFLVNIVDNDYVGDSGSVGGGVATPAAVPAAGAVAHVAGSDGDGGAGDGDEEAHHGPHDIFSVFKSIILRHMTSEQLADFTLETQRESEHLFVVIKELKAINQQQAYETKQLRGTLAQVQKELVDCKAQLNNLRIQRGYEQLSASNKLNGLLSARRAATPTGSPKATFFPPPGAP